MDLVKKIKEKYELSNLPDSLVKSTLENYLKKNPIKDVNSEKNQKIIVKEVRKELRRYAGQYASKSNIKNRKSLLENKKFSDLLNEHSSTRERIQDYPLVKEIIKKINPKIILDIGCGLNPIAIAENNVEYYAYDINKNDLSVLEEFSRVNKIKFHIFNEDITQLRNFPKTDLCIIFKVLDILPNKQEITEKLLRNIDTKYFLISFATRTLTGKPMNVVYRRWFENILKKLNLKYEIKRTSQELFYLIRIS